MPDHTNNYHKDISSLNVELLLHNCQHLRISVPLYRYCVSFKHVAIATKKL